MYYLRKKSVELSVFLCILLAVAAFLPALKAVCRAEQEAEDTTFAQIDTKSAKACLLIEPQTGKHLFELAPEEKLPAAGLSRLAPLLVICDAFDSGDFSKEAEVTVSDAASRIGGTTAFLRANERIKAEDLLLAAVMINAGDATHALASAVCGGETAAVERINSRMAALGLDGGFNDICGSGRLFSASELAKIAAELIKSNTYNEYCKKYYETISHEGAGDTELANPNKLIKQYSGCLGVGTGSSKEAGYCGVFAAQRGGTAFIAVVLGAINGSERFSAGISLLDYGFSAYRSVRIGSAGDSMGELTVHGSLIRTVGIEAAEDTNVLLRTSNAEYLLETELPEFLTAPVEKGATVGRLTARSTDGTLLAETDLIASDGAEAAGFSDCIEYILAVFCRKTPAHIQNRELVKSE